MKTYSFLRLQTKVRLWFQETWAYSLFVPKHKQQDLFKVLFSLNFYPYNWSYTFYIKDQYSVSQVNIFEIVNELEGYEIWIANKRWGLEVKVLIGETMVGAVKTKVYRTYGGVYFPFVALPFLMRFSWRDPIYRATLNLLNNPSVKKKVVDNTGRV